jgi:hypothetical protein
MKGWALLGLLAAIACGGEPQPPSGADAAAPDAPREAPAEAPPPEAGPVMARTVTPEGEVLEAEYGREGHLPAGFPDDVPLYAPARPLSSMASAEHGTVVNLRSGDPADAVFGWYREHYAERGWTIEHESQSPARSTVVARKGNRVSSVVIQGVPGATQVLLVVAEDR